MKKKIDIRIIAIVVLLIILIILAIAFGKDTSNQNIESSQNNKEIKIDKTSNSNATSAKGKTTSQISSALSESIELHATYYLEESYVTTNQEVKKGENILKYTNGTYLNAPYDCIISEINIPSSGEKCTNEHYVKIESLNSLSITLNIDETKISQYNIGDEVEITISATSEEVTGIITSISNTASNGKFTVKVEFENTGNIKIGMSANI